MAKHEMWVIAPSASSGQAPAYRSLRYRNYKIIGRRHDLSIPARPAVPGEALCEAWEPVEGSRRT